MLLIGGTVLGNVPIVGATLAVARTHQIIAVSGYTNPAAVSYRRITRGFVVNRRNGQIRSLQCSYNVRVCPVWRTVRHRFPSFAACPSKRTIIINDVGNGFDRSVSPNPRPFPFIQTRLRYHPGEQQAGFVCNRRNGQIRSLQYSHNKFAYRKPCTDHCVSVIRLISVQPFHCHYFM